jgi:hypothetical protein
MAKSHIYLIGTASGPRLVRAASKAVARNFVIDGFIGDVRMASAEDLARINQDAGGLVIEQAPIKVSEPAAE